MRRFLLRLPPRHRGFISEIISVGVMSVTDSRVESVPGLMEKLGTHIADSQASVITFAPILSDHNLSSGLAGIDNFAGAGGP